MDNHNDRQMTRDTGAEAGELLFCKTSEADQINQRSRNEKRALTWEGNRRWPRKWEGRV